MMKLSLNGPTLWRRFALCVVAMSLFVTIDTVEAQLRQRLLTRDDVGRLGLQRAWFSQIELDRSRNQVKRAVLSGDMLVVLTTAGVMQALDANTGETLWTSPIGNPNYPSLGPAVSDEHIALVNGSTLYVLDRQAGKPIEIRPVGGAPGASPALSNEFVFVPLVSGRIEGYPIGKKVLTPWYYQSFGRTMVPPLATPELLVWSTDRGYVYVADSEDPGVRFRLETGSEFAAQAAYAKPSIYVANLAGEVYALDETNGVRRWKSGTGYPVTRAPAIVGQRLFVTSEKPSLVAIDAETGASLWEAPGVTQFAAASRQRVYAVDDLGALVVFDAASGAPLGRLTTDGLTLALVNDQTDRVYLVSDDGMVQCLHEIGTKEPVRHGQPDQPGVDQSGTPAPTESQPSGRPNVAPPQTEDDESEPVAVEDDAAAEADATDPPDVPPAEDAFGTDDEDPFGFDL